MPRSFFGRIRDRVYGDATAPDGGPLRDTASSVLRNTGGLALWGSTTEEAYRPPAGLPPFRPDADADSGAADIPWELRDASDEDDVTVED